MNDFPDEKRNTTDRSVSSAEPGCGCDDVGCCSPKPLTGSSPQRKLRTLLFVCIVLAAIAVAAYSLFASGGAGEEVISLTGDDFAYLILAADEGGPDARVVAEVEKAVRSIAEQGVNIGIQNLLPADPAYAETVTGLGVSSFPAVLAVRNGGGTILVEGEIDEARLLKAYLSCCAPSASCCPGGSDMAGCKPTGCGK